MLSTSSTSSKRSRLGQIPQLFIFIMALLVIGATIFIGMKLLNGLEGTACSANDASFQQALSDLIDERAIYGLRDDAVIRTPCDAIMLCVVDERSLGIQDFAGNDSVITSSVRSGVKTNLFIKGRDETVPAGHDARILLAPHDSPSPQQDLCIPAVSGRFNFRTEGGGKYVIIRPQ